jgi:hypothetical protein
MTASAIPEYLADLVTDVVFINGVFRITFAQAGANNSTFPVSRVLIPANAYNQILKGLAKAGQNIAGQIQERMEETRKKDDGGNGSN